MSTKVKSYAITLRHDAGRVTIHTAATSMEMAINIVLACERAPRSAIVKVTEGSR